MKIKCETYLVQVGDKNYCTTKSNRMSLIMVVSVFFLVILFTGCATTQSQKTERAIHDHDIDYLKQRVANSTSNREIAKAAGALSFWNVERAKYSKILIDELQKKATSEDFDEYSFKEAVKWIVKIYDLRKEHELEEVHKAIAKTLQAENKWYYVVNVIPPSNCKLLTAFIEPYRYIFTKYPEWNAPENNRVFVSTLQLQGLNKDTSSELGPYNQTSATLTYDTEPLEAYLRLIRIVGSCENKDSLFIRELISILKTNNNLDIPAKVKYYTGKAKEDGWLQIDTGPKAIAGRVLPQSSVPDISNLSLAGSFIILKRYIPKIEKETIKALISITGKSSRNTSDSWIEWYEVKNEF